jgi:phosphate transport system protein
MNAQHLSKSFDADIGRLRSELAAMGELVRGQFTLATEAFCDGALHLVPQIERNEGVVNSLQVQVDELCQLTIARHHPTAVDLRELISALHTVHDLERIGDESKKIARRARRLHANPIRSDLPLAAIASMAAEAARVFSQALQAFNAHDVILAAAVGEMDRKVNALRDQLISELQRRMVTDREALPSLLSLVFVVQSVERVGDHAKSLAANVIHVVAGVDVRHQVSL